MTNQEERDRLLQKEWREGIIPGLGTESWVTVYQRHDTQRDEYLIMYTGLVSEGCIGRAKNSFGWNIYVDQNEPSLVERFDEVTGERNRRFELFGTEYGIVPFVFVRTFGGFVDAAFEISEEFRFLHRLYFDTETGHYMRFNETGTEEIIVQISHNKVRVRRQELRQFLAARRMYLMFFVIRAVYSELPIASIGEGEQTEDIENDDYHYKFWVVPNMRISPEEPPTMSKLHAKRFLRPGPIEDTRLYPFEENHSQEYERFLLGVDADDKKVFYTCDPESLGPDYADHTCRLPDYRLPVWFSSEVLSEQDKYHVYEGESAGTFYIGEKATVQYSIPRPGFVTVELGQLGRYLPDQEQSRWSSYNVSPIDDRWFRNSNISAFHGNAMRFRKSYEDFLSSWNEKQKWALLHELAPDDNYHIEQLGRLIDNSYSGIDNVALAISKLISDSINDSALRQFIPDNVSDSVEERDKPKITILQDYLNHSEYEDSQGHIKFLRDVQSLRSESAAHRKSRKPKAYRKILHRLCPDYRHLIQVADAIYINLADFLDSLRAHFCPDEAT